MNLLEWLRFIPGVFAFGALVTAAGAIAAGRPKELYVLPLLLLGLAVLTGLLTWALGGPRP